MPVQIPEHADDTGAACRYGGALVDNPEPATPCPAGCAALASDEPAMTGRFAHTAADEVEVTVAGPGTRLADTIIGPGRYAVVLGDPEATALVIEGTSASLRGVIATLSHAVTRLL